MKKSLLSTLIMLLFSVMSFAQGAGDWRIHPDDAEYKIYGHFETTFTNNGNVSYELTEVKPVGLSFPVQKKYFGGHTTGGNVFFTFDHVKYQGILILTTLLSGRTMTCWENGWQMWKQEKKKVLLLIPMR